MVQVALHHIGAAQKYLLVTTIPKIVNTTMLKETPNETSHMNCLTYALNTWTQLQVHVVTTGAATGTVDVAVNGTSVYHSSTATVSPGGISAVQIGNNTASQAFTIVADNIVVANGAPAAPPVNTSTK